MAQDSWESPLHCSCFMPMSWTTKWKLLCLPPSHLKSALKSLRYWNLLRAMLSKDSASKPFCFQGNQILDSQPGKSGCSRKRGVTVE